MPASMISEYVKKLMEIFPQDKYDNYSKLIVNAFLGSLRTRYNKREKGFITNSFETVCGMFHDMDNKNNFNIYKLHDLFFCSHTDEV